MFWLFFGDNISCLTKFGKPILLGLKMFFCYKIKFIKIKLFQQTF